MTYTTCVIHSGRGTLALPAKAHHTDPNEAHAFADHLARNEYIVAVFGGQQRVNPLSVWVFGREYMPRVIAPVDTPAEPTPEMFVAELEDGNP